MSEHAGRAHRPRRSAAQAPAGGPSEAGGRREEEEP